MQLGKNPDPLPALVEFMLSITAVDPRTTITQASTGQPGVAPGPSPTPPGSTQSISVLARTV